MNVRFWLFISVLVPILSGFGHGQKLDTSGRAFARDLSRAPWARPIDKGPMKVSVRKARLGSSGMLNAVRNAGELSGPERLALADVARVTIKEKGWFVRSPIEPGEYRFGLTNEKGSVHWVLRDSQGKLLGKRAIIIFDASKRLATYDIMEGNECHVLRINCSGITFKFRFISAKAHDQVTRTLETVKSKRIHLHTDLKNEEFLGALIADLEAGIDSQLKIYPGTAPQGIFNLYLFRNQDDYLRMDSLMTDGEFATTGGFASRLTNRAYFNFRLAPEPLRDGKTGYPLLARAAIIHELNHLVAEELQPGAVGYWTSWFAEGLAELGVELAFKSQGKGDDDRFYRQQVGAIRYHESKGTLPTVTDWSGGKMETNREAFYSLSYLVCRRLFRDSPILTELLAINDTVRATVNSERLLRLHLEEKYGSLKNLFTLVMDEVRAQPIEPAKVHGFLDTDKSRFRVTALYGKDARVIWPVIHKSKQQFRLSVDFSFLDCKNNQVDIYFGYHEGRHTKQFMKVALLPRYIELWRSTHGKWQKVASRRFKDALDLGEAGDLRWHNAVVRYQQTKKTLKVNVGSKRLVEFELDQEPLLVGGNIGIGTWGGAAWFKSPKLKDSAK
ncbi:MAG: hypothetical protein ACI97A_001003 [Planctomycetota bacterium]|jgi:hypothetical protein